MLCFFLSRRWPKLGGVVVDGAGVAGSPVAERLVHIRCPATLWAVHPGGPVRAQRREEPGEVTADEEAGVTAEEVGMFAAAGARVCDSAAK